MSFQLSTSPKPVFLTSLAAHEVSSTEFWAFMEFKFLFDNRDVIWIKP